MERIFNAVNDIDHVSRQLFAYEVEYDMLKEESSRSAITTTTIPLTVESTPDVQSNIDVESFMLIKHKVIYLNNYFYKYCD
jgi:hypothetical protein